MTSGFDFNVQGVYKIVDAVFGGESATLLVFHTVEDGAGGGNYWVLARRLGRGPRWEEVHQEGVVPRLHPKDRQGITREEKIDREDAGMILLLCECTSRFSPE